MSRREAIDGVLEAGRVIGAEAVLFHAALSARMGLSPVEEKTLDVLQRAGPLSAGELSKHTGLAPPSVTGLINRLEKKGFVRRVADDEDGRRVRVAVIPESLAAFGAAFGPLVRHVEAACEGYSVDELALCARFMREAAAAQHRALEELASIPALVP